MRLLDWIWRTENSSDLQRRHDWFPFVRWVTREPDRAWNPVRACGSREDGDFEMQDVNLSLETCWYLSLKRIFEKLCDIYLTTMNA